MGWLQLVGLIKLYVSFAKETYKRNDILQKRPIILSILLTVATPYANWRRLHLLGAAIYRYRYVYIVSICAQICLHSVYICAAMYIYICTMYT